MKIERIYIGGWFQRTMLQLTEIYDFLREKSSKLKLEQEKLDELHKNLAIGKIDYGVDGEEYVVITNFSKDEELINFPFDNYTLVISNYNSNYSKSSLTLKPYEALLLKRK